MILKLEDSFSYLVSSASCSALILLMASCKGSFASWLRKRSRLCNSTLVVISVLFACPKDKYNDAGFLVDSDPMEKTVEEL